MFFSFCHKYDTVGKKMNLKALVSLRKVKKKKGKLD